MDTNEQIAELASVCRALGQQIIKAESRIMAARMLMHCVIDTHPNPAALQAALSTRLATEVLALPAAPYALSRADVQYWIDAIAQRLGPAGQT